MNCHFVAMPSIAKRTISFRWMHPPPPVPRALFTCVEPISPRTLSEVTLDAEFYDQILACALPIYALPR